MPSGKTHDVVTYLAMLPVFVAGYWAFDFSAYHSLLLMLGVFWGGIYLAPDLDTRSRPFYRWGLLRFIWWPYQWMVRHRSVLSHGIFIGPVFRVLYVSALLIVSYLSLRGSHPDHVLSFLSRHASDFLWLMAGIWLGCALHVVLDHTDTNLKRIGFR